MFSAGNLQNARRGGVVRNSFPGGGRGDSDKNEPNGCTDFTGSSFSSISTAEKLFNNGWQVVVVLVVVVAWIAL